MAKLISFNRAAISIMLAGATVLSCVNPDYDLSKGVDMDMTLLPNCTLPLGNMASISVTDLFGDLDSTGVVVAENGDLSLSLGAGEDSSSYDLPPIEMGEDGFTSGNTVVRFQTGVSSLEIPGFSDEEIHFGDIDQEDKGDDSALETHIEIDVDKELPKEIMDIKLINMDKATIEYVFEVSEGGIVHLKDGFMLEFPHYMVLDKVDGIDSYELLDDYIVRFTEDVRVSENEPLVLKFRFVSLHGHEYDEQGNITVDLLDFQEVCDAEGNKTATRISHKDYLDIKGDLYLKHSDYAAAGIHIPSVVELKMYMVMDHLEMTSAEMMLDLNLEVSPQTIETGFGSEMFAQDGIVIDLYNPSMMLSVDNSSPMSMNVNADITSYAGNHSKTIHIGDQETEPILIPADDVEEFCISQRGNDRENTAKEVVVEDFGDIIKDNPEQIEIHNVMIEPEDKFISIEAECSFKVDIDYKFVAPLAFGEDLSLAFSYEIPLAADSSLELGSCILGMNMENTIPLDFHITAQAVDAEGNVIEDADVDIDLVVKGGTLDEPTVTPVEISVISDGSSPVHSLLLSLKAGVPEGMEGVTLNEAAGINLKDMSLRLPDGITLDLTSVEE